MEGLISVIIPVYNRQTTIKRAVDSVLGQTYQDIEILVVDDGSSDKTMELVQAYDDHRIRIFHQEHMGASRARNKGIEEARGMYIAFQDSDDEWMEDKLAKQILHMQKNGLKVCYCPYELHDKDAAVMPVDYQDSKYETDIREILRYTNVIGTPCLIAERSVFADIGKFNTELSALEDYELMVRIAQRYKIGYCPEVLVKAYRQENSVSVQKRHHLESVCRIIRKHVDYIDYRAILRGVYRNTSFFEEEKPDWAYLSFLRKECGLEDAFDEITLEYLHQKYMAAETLLELLQRREWRAFRSRLRSNEFAIYGAGHYARKIATVLREGGLKPRCFLVTQMVKEKRYVDGIPIENLKEEYRYLPILIGTNFENQREICRLLERKHFDDYCTYPVYDLE